MSSFYNYDTRGASAASQIINLERMVKERDAEIERLRGENNVLASLLTCWVDPMLRGGHSLAIPTEALSQWAISAETLDQLLMATNKALGDDSVRQSNNPPT